MHLLRITFLLAGHKKLKTVFLQKVEASPGEIYRTAVQSCICGELKNSSNDPMMILNSFEMRQ
jgi:hypothetical protein